MAEKTAKEKIISFFKSHASVLIGGGVVAIICALFAGISLNKSMPMTEGWYSYYASLINEKGAVPYKDFELLFPPTYTYLIAGITKLFGYKIIVLRVFGLFVYVSTGIFAFLVFYELFQRSLLGVLGGLLAVAFLQSEVAQIYYDYIRLMDLNVYISVWFFLRYIGNVRRAKSTEEAEETEEKEKGFSISWNLLFGTFFAVQASLYKQSSGLFFLLFCIAVLLFSGLFYEKGERKEYWWKDLLTVLAVVVICYGIVIVFLAAKGALSAYFYYNFQASTEAKGGGSFLTLLFGWIPRSKHAILQNVVPTLLMVAVFVGEVVLSKKFFSEKKSEKLDWIFIGVFGGLIFVCVAIMAASISFSKFVFSRGDEFGYPSNWEMYTSFFVVTILFAASAILLIFRKKVKGFEEKDRAFVQKYFCLSGTAFVLAYAVCTSGGLAESQVALCLALMLTSIVHFARFKWKNVVVVATALVMFLETGASFGRKVITPYSWWGLNVGNLKEQTRECDIPIFEGIKMNSAYANMYDHVYNGVRQYSGKGDEIFVFPHMPILYLATNREKATFTALQWFDVSTDKEILSDITVLETKKPKVLVLCFIDEYVRTSHEKMFRDNQKSGLTQMQEFLVDFVSDGGYTQYSSDKVSDGYIVEVYVRS